MRTVFSSMSYLRAATLFILLVVAGCTTEHPFAPPPPPPPVEPPPATHPIIFSSYRDTTAGRRNLEVLAATTDGSDIVNLTHNAANDLDPSWSPDGQSIAFSSDRNGNYDIFIMKKDGSDVRQLTFDTIDERFPRWSPDGTKILFESDRDGLLREQISRSRFMDIFVIDIDGSHLSNLTKTPSAYEYGASWSPDGKTIAFLRLGTGILLVNSDGTNERPLHAPQSGFLDDAVAWSPNGKLLAYSAFNLNHPMYVDTYAIFTVNPDGSNVQRITQLGYSSARFPSFSPDGTRIVYNRDAVDEWWGRFSTQNVFIMNVDGSNNIQITKDQSARNELGSPQAWTR